MSEEQQDLPKPLHWDDLYENRFFKPIDLKGQPFLVFTVSDVTVERRKDTDQRMKKKGMLSFRGTDKQLPVNRTNGLCLKAMWGTDLRTWIGKQLAIYVWETKVRNPNSGEQEEVVRVYGSPDLERNLTVEIALPQRSKFKMTMRAIKAAGAQQKPAQQQNAPAVDWSPLERAYRECTTDEAFKALEAERKALWPQLPGAGKKALIDASGAAAKRIAAQPERQPGDDDAF